MIGLYRAGAFRRERRAGTADGLRGVRMALPLVRTACVCAAVWSAAAVVGCSLPAPNGNNNDNGSPGEPKAQLVFEGLRTSLMSVSGTSANDVYAVGADLGAGDGPNVLHFNGTRWRRLATGLGAADLWWISVTTVDGRFLLAGADGLVARFDPRTATFERFETPGSETMFGVWAASESVAFAVGGDLDEPDTGGVIWRYDGESWTVEDVGEAGVDGLPALYKVWGRGPDDVYVVGRTGLILRYDGERWTRAVAETSRTLFTVHGTGSQVCAVGGLVNGVLVETEGEAFVDRTPAGAVQLNGVFLKADGGGAAVGLEGRLFLRNSAGWQNSPVTFDTIQEWHGVWIDPEGGVWSVGGDLSADLDEGVVGYYGTRTIPDTVER